MQVFFRSVSARRVLRLPAQGIMVALDIKPPSGLCTHERMTAYIASKGVTELYADSLEALLKPSPTTPPSSSPTTLPR